MLARADLGAGTEGDREFGAEQVRVREVGLPKRIVAGFLGPLSSTRGWHSALKRAYRSDSEIRA